jgi:hypothetical protein
VVNDFWEEADNHGITVTQRLVGVLIEPVSGFGFVAVTAPSSIIESELSRS